MQRRFLIFGLLLVPIVIVCAAAYLPRYMVGIHQQSVTQSLVEWRSEYSDIASKQEALRTAGMLEYIQGYYVPGEGYRSTPEIEERLESERQATIDAFVAALREFAHEDFGTDAQKWLMHLRAMDEGAQSQ